ncbi:hypothetical protein RchiOBHm_Chr4g0436591 [Rosa chinensis]|uniref:Uncharacterized protein n=1 Tax=Rosa chinensis TaxID=74649 RepID=A0A2P6R230_ROSCH|nr:hypothetical protein RchiOBHm_Chr4g0436591 [Rosa chinensis]
MRLITWPGLYWYIAEGGLTVESKRWVPRRGKTPQKYVDVADACTSWKNPSLFPKNYINEVEPKALDRSLRCLSAYGDYVSQRLREMGDFTAKSVASDGIPPRFLREKGWRVYMRTPYNYELGEALKGFTLHCGCAFHGSMVMDLYLILFFIIYF